MAYAAENNVDHDRWGYQVMPGMNSCSWTKLCLEANRPRQQANARGLGDDIFHIPHGMNAGAVVRDFLQQVHDHIWTTAHFRSLQQPKVHYVFTVPASFSEPAQLAIRDAAAQAGFNDGEILLVKEPEAAAMHVFESGHLSKLKVSTANLRLGRMTQLTNTWWAK